MMPYLCFVFQTQSKVPKWSRKRGTLLRPWLFLFFMFALLSDCDYTRHFWPAWIVAQPVMKRGEQSFRCVSDVLKTIQDYYSPTRREEEDNLTTTYYFGLTYLLKESLDLAPDTCFNLRLYAKGEQSFRCVDFALMTAHNFLKLGYSLKIPGGLFTAYVSSVLRQLYLSIGHCKFIQQILSFRDHIETSNLNETLCTLQILL